MIEWLVENTIVASAIAVCVTLICLRLKHQPALCHMLWVLVLIRLLAPPLPFLPSPLSDHVGPLVASTADRLQPDPIIKHTSEALLEADYLVYSGTEVDLDGFSKLYPDQESKQLKIDKKKMLLKQKALAKAGSSQADQRVQAAGISLQLGLPFYVILLWAFGTLFVLAIQLKRMWDFHKVLKYGESASPEILEEMGEIARSMGVKIPKVLLFPNISAPFIWSVGRPVLLWPEWKAPAGRGRGYRSILAHELAHLKRRDHWFSYLEVIGLILLWWHPLFWLARNRVKLYAEHACDAWAVWCFPRQRKAFAVALIDAAEKAIRPTFAVTALNATPSNSDQFKRRLKMIMKKGFSPKLSKTGIGCAMIALFLVLPSWSTPQKEDNSDTSYIAKMDTALQPIIKGNLALVNAKRQIKLGDYDKAIAWLEDAIDLQPQRQELKYKLAHILVKNGQAQQALAVFNSIDETALKGKRHFKKDLFLAKVHADLGEMDQALSYLENAVKQGNVDPEVLVQERFESLSSHPNFASLTQEALKIQRDMKKAKVAMNEKDWEQAIAQFEATVKRAPQATGLYGKMGLAAIYAGSYDRAIDSYKKLLQYQPDNATAHYNMACSYALMGKKKLALTSLEKAIAHGFDDSKLVMSDSDLDSIREESNFNAIIDELVLEYQLGQDLEKAFKQKDYQAVLDLVQKADTMDSLSEGDQAWLRKKEAFAYYYLKQYDQAGEAFRDLIVQSHGKDVGNQFYNLACVHSLNGQIDDAFLNLKAAFDLGYKDASNFMKDSDLENLRSDERYDVMAKEIKMRAVMKKLDICDEADLKKLMKKASNDHDLGKKASKVAWAAYQLGEYPAAIKAFEQTMKHGKKQGTTAYNIACCYALDGQTDMAFKWLEKSIKLGYHDFHHMKKDHDLESLRQDSRFEGIVTAH